MSVEPVVVEHPGGAVAAQQQPVAGRELDVEQVGVGLVHPVDRAQDQVAVRVGPGLLLGDPALVDQALHERVVLGELRQRAVAQEVAAAVADVREADPVAVEERRRDRRAGAVELGLLLDELGDPVVRPVDGAGEGLEQVRGRRAVEPAERLHGGAAGHVAAGRAAHAVGDDQQVLARVAGVLVVLADPADVGQRGVAQREPVATGLGDGIVGTVVLLHRGQPYFLSSRVVFPIRTVLPSCRVVGWVSRWEPM